MIARLRPFIFSIQTKMVAALAAVIILAIFLAGLVFVFRTRDDRQDAALDRVAAASPAIYQQAFYALLPRDENDPGFYDVLDALADEQDVRILIIGSFDVVLYDTAGALGGEHLTVPPSTPDDVRRGFVSWHPPEGSGEEELTYVAASSRFVTNTGAALPFRIVLAVETDTIASAWVTTRRRSSRNRSSISSANAAPTSTSSGSSGSRSAADGIIGVIEGGSGWCWRVRPGLAYCSPAG